MNIVNTVRDVFKGKWCLNSDTQSGDISTIQFQIQQLREIDYVKAESIYKCIHKYMNVLYEYLHVVPINPDDRFIKEFTIPESNVSERPICGVLNNKIISCKQLPHLMRKKHTTLLPMMYHALQGYRLLHQICKYEGIEISQFENLQVSVWESTYKNILDENLDTILRGNGKGIIHQYKTQVRKILKVLNQIRFLRSVNSKYCVDGTDDSHIQFNKSMDAVYNHIFRRKDTLVPTGSKQITKKFRRDHRRSL